jgi:hypothetical protein
MANVLTLNENGRIEEQSVSLGSSLSGTTVLNFENENDSVVNTITSNFITSSNISNVFFIPQETAETTLDDFSLNGLIFNIENIINNISFDVRATAFNNASGNYTVKYLITY